MNTPEPKSLSKGEIFAIAGFVGLVAGVIVWFLSIALIDMAATGTDVTVGYRDHARWVLTIGILVSYLGTLLIAVLAKNPKLWFLSLAGYLITVIAAL